MVSKQFCIILVLASAFVSPAPAATPYRPPTQRPVQKARPKAPVPTPKKGSKTTSSRSKSTKKPAKPTDMKSLPSDGDPTFEIPVVTPILPVIPEQPSEANKVQLLFPDTAVAHMEDDNAYRLLVTINGTKFLRESDDLYRLEKGSVLVSPHHTLVVSTPASQVELHEGSVVSIDATSTTTYIRDFHDRWKGHVIVKTGDSKYALMPGTEMVVTKETDPEVAWKNAIRHQIRRRGLKQIKSNAAVKVYKGDFSIPDAMLKSNHFLLLKEQDGSHKAKSVIDEVLKTAALLHMTDRGAPFTLMQ